jgi:hypothetical protein
MDNEEKVEKHEISDIAPTPNRKQRRAMRSKRGGPTQSGGRASRRPKPKKGRKS